MDESTSQSSSESVIEVSSDDSMDTQEPGQTLDGREEANMHTQLKERCQQAVDACRSLNEKSLDMTMDVINQFREDVKNRLSQLELEILCKVNKHKEENERKLEGWQHEIASHTIEDSICNAEAVTDSCKSLARLYQDITINTLYVKVDRSVLESIRNSCKLEQQSTIKVCSLNVNGLESRLRKQPFTEFIKQHEILCFTEINAYETDGDKLKVEGYKHYLKCRPDTGRRSGGICIYVHSKFKENVEVLDGKCDYVSW